MSSQLTLELSIGPVSVQPAPRVVMEALTQAQVTVSATGKSGFDLSFAVSTLSPITTQLLPGGFFDPPNRVIISATFGASTTVLIDGVITHQELVASDEPGKSVLSIKGEDLSRMMDLVDLSGLPYPAMPPEARVAIMLAKYLPIYGVVPLIMPSVLMVVPSPTDRIPAQRGTDLNYIKQLADQVGYSFFIHAGPVAGMSLAYWGPMLRTSIPFLPDPPDVAIDRDGRSNVESLQFALDGFAKTQFVILVQVEGVPIPIPVPVPDITPLSPPLGAKQPMPLKISPLTGLGKYNPLQAAAIGMARAASSANVVSGQGTLDVTRYGAIMNARTMVAVRGAGITYDGQYFVESVTHTIKPGSYKETFSLSRNALIAGNGLSDLGSYLGSPAQQLAGLASSASTPAGPLAAAMNAIGGPVGSSGLPFSGGSGAGPALPASPQT
jgi:hypothetical protein